MTDRGTGGSRTGSTIGPYVLHEEIGRGGMGVVYRATRADSGLEVAIKLMLPELSSNLRFRERFIAEAQTAPKLDHPNIVPIYEAGEADSELYIAMRLVEGPDLKQVIESGGRLPPQRALGIVGQVSAALDYAHGIGVVHRDVKPQNILLDASGDATKDHVYITDFGLVKPAGSESTASRTSEVFGSIQYMAPEQVEGMPTDGRADVYSLGCVTFEALTGAIPFDRPNEVAVLWAHVHESPPRVTDLKKDLPGGLDIAVANAMAKHPDDRYLTCGEFSEAVQEGLEKTQRAMFMPTVRPLVARIPRKKTEREVWAPNFFPEISRVRRLTNKPNWVRTLGIAATLSILVAGIVQFAHPGGLVGAAEDAVDVADAIVDTVTGNDVELNVADGNTREPGRDQQDGGDAGGENQRGSGGFGTSGKGSQPPVSGPPSVVEENIPTNEIVFIGFDGEDDEIYKTDATTGGVVRLTDNETIETYPNWSPNGTMIAFARVGPGSISELWVMNSDGSDQHRVLALGGRRSESPSERPDVSWAPDGKRLVYSFQGIYVVNLDGTEKRLLADSRNANPDWSPNGDKIVYTRRISDAGRAVWIMNADGSDQHQITASSEPTGTDADPTWTPDGTRVVFSRGSFRVTYREEDVTTTGLFFVDPDGANLQRLSEGRGEYQPSAGPGAQFVFIGPSDQSGYGNLYLINSDGTNKRQLTTERRFSAPDWSLPSS